MVYFLSRDLTLGFSLGVGFFVIFDYNNPKDKDGDYRKLDDKVLCSKFYYYEDYDSYIELSAIVGQWFWCEFYMNKWFWRDIFLLLFYAKFLDFYFYGQMYYYLMFIK